MSNNKNRILFSHEQKTKVGIGTDTPSALLHLVTGETHETIPMIQMDSPNPKIVFNDSTNTGSMMIKWQAAPGVHEGLRFFRDANDAEGDPDFMIDLAGDCLLANNVGIGTTSPDDELHIYGDGPAFQVEDNSGPVAKVYAGDSDVQFGSWSNHPVRFNVGASEKMRILSDGNVGIGIASPTSKLDIGTTSQTSDTILNLSWQHLNNTTSIEQRIGWSFGDDATISTPIETAYIAAGKQGGYVVQQQRSSYLSFATEHGIQQEKFGGSEPNYTPVERMRIAANGNVGIGTTNPEYTPLHVKGSNDTSFPDSAHTVVIEGTDQFDSGVAGGGISFVGKYTADTPTTLGSVCVIKENPTSGEYGGVMTFGTRKNAADSSVSLEKMRITSTGNVGIGTTSPDVKLEVKGASAAVGVDNEIISVQTATANHRLSIGVNSEDEYAWIRSVKAGSELPLILNGVNAGSVGIGTTDPGAAFHVNKSSTGDNQALLISNYDKTVGTGQSTRLLFGLARNSGTIKPTAGKIFVGRSSDWTADDSKLNSFMRFSIMDGMNDKDQLNISTGGADFRGYVGTDEIRCKSALLGGARNGIKINVGESDVWEANNLGHEWLYVNAEEGIQVNTSPDNWASAWAGRDTTTISGTEIKINNKEVWHEGNIGNDVGLMRRFKHQKTLTKATETRVLRITSTHYASAIKIHMWGTTGNVVVNTLAEILANHALSVNMSTSTGGYTGVTWRVVSSDDKFDLYVTYGTAGSNQGNSLPATFSVNVYGDENVYWSPTDTAHVPYVVNSSGTNEHTHNTGTNTIHHTARGDVDLRVGGSIVGDSIRTYGHNVDGGATEMILDGQFGNKLFFHRSFGIAHTGTSNTFTKYFNFCLQSTGGCYYKVTMLSQRYNDSGSGTGNRFYGCIVDEGFLSWESDGDYGTNHESKLTSNLGGLSVVSKSCFLADSTTATATTPDNNNYGNCIVRYGVQFNGVIDTTNSGQMVYVNVELTTVHGNNTITSPHFLNT